MFIITIIILILINQQLEQDRLAENQPRAGLSSLNEHEYENGMRKPETELLSEIHLKFSVYNLNIKLLKELSFPNSEIYKVCKYLFVNNMQQHQV